MSELNRRAFIAQSAALGGASLLPNLGFAQSLEMGGMQVQTVSDGSLTLPAGFIFDPMPKDELAAIREKHGVTGDVLEPPCNVTLVRDEERVILFDVGSGPDFAPNAGDLVETLDGLGVAPEDVSHVLFTHGHPDHLWGLLDDFDDPLFPEASFVMGRTEFDYWMNPETVNSIGDARAAFAVGAKRRLEVIEEQISLVEDGEEVLPGIAARACFGHSPGHMAFELSRGSESVLVVGDAIGNGHVAFEAPQWRSGSDQDADMAIASRMSLLGQLAETQMRVIGFHLPSGGMGRVERAGDVFRFVPEGA